jgi:hypothetical protein
VELGQGHSAEKRGGRSGRCLQGCADTDVARFRLAPRALETFLRPIVYAASIDGPDRSAIAVSLLISSERWRRIEQLYHDVFELTETERGGFLEQACGADITLRTEVEALLSQSDARLTTDAAPARGDSTTRVTTSR